jgi:ribosomal-protein-alanine N-acetyltransferase
MITDGGVNHKGQSHMRYIRPARPHDAPAFTQVQREVWPQDRWDEAQIAAVIADGHHLTLIAEVEGQAAGFIDGFLTIAPDSLIRLEVDLLAVRPAYQGRGIGRRLVTEITRAGAAYGAQIARAVVRVGNLPAEMTFARCGYRRPMPDYTLFTAQPLPSTRPLALGNTYACPVVTLSYSGLWLEGQVDQAAFETARILCSQYGWDAAGMLIPSDDAITCAAATRAGYELAGEFSVWTLDNLAQAATEAAERGSRPDRRPG